MAVQPRETRLTAQQFFHEYPADGKRYELIDGELREMTTANIRHQRINSRLFLLLHSAVSTTGGEVFSSGVGIDLGGGSVLIPDMVVLNQRSDQIDTEYGLTTAPDIVVEILSPSTARYDRGEKSERYATFGVRELWLVSPEAEIIEVFALAESRYVLHVRVGLDEPIRSTVLPHLSFLASTVFAS
ncbi:MAG: Uma2 family endonuclease [Chloroflexota bacterium]|nr:Uma2 family endonuclease [Chloroflexota bacterium]